MEGLRVVKLEKRNERQDLGIKAGDVLVALDDDDLTSHESLKQSVTRLIEAGETTAIIEYTRDGEHFEVSAYIDRPFGLVLKPIKLDNKSRNSTTSSTNGGSFGNTTTPSIPMISFILYVLAFLLVATGFFVFLSDVNNHSGQILVVGSLVSAIFWVALGTIIHYLADIRHYLRAKKDT